MFYFYFIIQIVPPPGEETPHISLSSSANSKSSIHARCASANAAFFVAHRLQGTLHTTLHICKRLFSHTFRTDFLGSWLKFERKTFFMNPKLPASP
jgi:hypothetical protein